MIIKIKVVCFRIVLVIYSCITNDLKIQWLSTADI